MAAGRRLAFAEATRRNAEVIRAMGMSGEFSRQWAGLNTRYMELQQKGSDVTSGLGSASRIFRMLLQSVILAVGAYLVMNQEATGGIIMLGDNLGSSLSG